jgi:hypothetical protein
VTGGAAGTVAAVGIARSGDDVDDDDDGDDGDTGASGLVDAAGWCGGSGSLVSCRRAGVDESQYCWIQVQLVP